MPLTRSSDGIEVYYEQVGEGPAIVLLHGFSAGLQRWKDVGYFDALGNDYSVIAIDARGHGRSGKPHERSAYSLDVMVDDVTAVMDAESVERAHLWGYSMGGHQVMRLWDRAPERVISAILGGSAATERPKLGEDHPQVAALRAGMDAYIEFMDPTGNMLSEEARNFQRAHDPTALAELRVSMLEWPEQGPELTCPTLVYAGDQDGVHNAARHYATTLPNARFESVLGGNHGTTFAVSPPIVTFVRQFLESTVSG